MDFNNVTTFITTVGFPIAMCCALLWYCYKQNVQHKEESDKLAEAMHDMSIAIQQLTDYLRR